MKSTKAKWRVLRNSFSYRLYILTILWVFSLSTFVYARSVKDILSVAKPNRNLGEIIANQPVSIEFVFKNKTTKTIALRMLPAKCGCGLMYSFNDAVLPPLKSVKLNIKFVPPNYEGDFFKEIPFEAISKSVESSDTLTIEGYIKAQIEWRPHRIDLGDIKLKTPTKEYFYLFSPKPLSRFNNLKLTLPPHMSYKLTLSKNRKIIRLESSLIPTKTGNLYDVIYCRIPQNGKFQKIFIPIFAYVHN